MRLPGIAVLTGAVLLLSACDGGSRSFVEDYYRLDVSWKQDSLGRVGVLGKTDLPEGSEIDVILTTSPDPKKAIDGAVMNGSTRSPGSFPVAKPKDNKHAEYSNYLVVVDHVLAETCKRQPPCGPFPAGTYYLLVNAKTPHENLAGVTTYQDPRYLDQVHGYNAFAGLEIFKKVQLHAINLHMDENGHQVNPEEPAPDVPGVPASPGVPPVTPVPTISPKR
ncbi:MAG: hypothetical protein ACYDGR_14655 [Candidatus Dormibacteria bacterium]